MSTTDIYNMAQTWNNGAVDFTAIKMNVTDTASGSGSLLLDLQVGGSSKFKVAKDGTATVSRLDTASNTGVRGSGSRLPLQIGTSDYAWVVNSGVRLNSSGSFSWVNGGLDGGSTDLYLLRDAANTLAQRNGANAQEFRLYNTYTDGSNYERGCVKWSSNTLIIGTENAGTGTKRAIRLNNVGFINGSGDSDQGIGLSAAGYMSWTDNAGTEKWRFGSNLEAHPVFHIQWANSSSVGGPKDVGLTRNAAGVLKVTNGSTGAGQLIFVVPTSDPAIAGALWNNAGTLAISAG